MCGKHQRLDPESARADGCYLSTDRGIVVCSSFGAFVWNDESCGGILYILGCLPYELARQHTLLAGLSRDPGLLFAIGPHCHNPTRLTIFGSRSGPHIWILYRKVFTQRCLSSLHNNTCYRRYLLLLRCRVCGGEQPFVQETFRKATLWENRQGRCQNLTDAIRWGEKKQKHEGGTNFALLTDLWITLGICSYPSGCDLDKSSLAGGHRKPNC